MGIPMPPHTALFRTTLAFIGALGLAVCTAESTGPDTDPGNDFGDGLETVSCTGLAPSDGSAVPLTRIPAGSLPESLEPPLAARVLAADGTMGFAWFEIGEEGDAELVTPLHPSGSIQGGQVRIRATDGVVGCEPWTFTIEPLPEAAGELGAVVDQLQSVISARAAALGAVPEDLRTTRPEELPEVLVPVGVMQWVLDHPDNDFSLRAVAEGSSSEDVPLERLEALLAQTGLREALTMMDLPATEGLSAAPLRAVQPESCTPDDVGTSTQLLSDCVSLATSIRQERPAEILEAIAPQGPLLGAALLAEWIAPGEASGAVRSVLSGLGWVAIQEELASLATLPTLLDDPVLEADPARFQEDDPTLGEWRASITARSSGWNYNVDILEDVLALTGVEALEALEALPAAPDFREAVDRLLGDAVADFLDTEEMGIRVFGPVWVHDEAWSDVDYAALTPGGPSVIEVEHNRYRAVAVGRTGLSIHVPPSDATQLFGGLTRTQRTVLEVDSLIVRIEPSDTILPLGASATFRVTVENAYNPGPLMVEATEGTVTDLEQTGENTWNVTYVAPLGPAARGDVVAATDLATEGEGAQVNGPVRADLAYVQFAGVRITSEPACVELGAEPIAMAAETIGAVEASDLRWSASLGTITEDTGIYTPPSVSAVDTVTVALVSDPRISDSVVFPVGGCSCQANLTLDGASVEVTSLTYRLSADLSGVQSLEWSGTGLASGTFGFGTDPFQSAVIPFGQRGENALTSGQTNLIQFFNPLDPNDPQVAPLALDLAENSESVLAGTIGGSVRVPADPEPYTVQLSMTFRAVADPFLSDEAVKQCEVVTSSP